MNKTTEEFIQRFQSISGTTLGERRKSLFLLLHETSQSASTVAELNLSLLQPSTPLEELFKIEALIYFKRIPELVDVLKNENPVLIKKILKPWFIKEALVDVSGEQLVTLIFPYVSYNVKLKIVYKLGVVLDNTQQADDYFRAIHAKYGLNLALKLLSSCSPKIIVEHVLEKYRQLTSRQLMCIIKKVDYNVTLQILDKVNDNTAAYILVKLLNNDLLVDLLKTYSSSKLHFGRRITHKILKTNIDIMNIYEHLHKKQTAKDLKQNFPNFFVQIFPKSPEQFRTFQYLLFNYIKHLSNDKQFCLLDDTFSKVYSISLLDSNCLNEPLLNIIPLQRYNDIKNKPNFYTEERWFCYTNKLDDALTYIKKRIRLTSDIKTRSNFIKLMVETCKINNDAQALLDVCKYVIEQHRNDHISVREGFLVAVRYYFKLEDLIEHWVYIDEFLSIFDMNKEHFRLSVEFLISKIHMRLRLNQPVVNELSEFVKLQCERWNLFRSNRHFERQCLLIIGNIIPDLVEGDYLKQCSVSYLKALVDWNKRHPKEEISLFLYPFAINCFRQVLSEPGHSWHYQEIIIYFLQLKPFNLEEDLLNLCLTKLELFYGNQKILDWLLRFNPQLVCNNIEDITNRLLKKHRRFFWRFCRNYTHLKIPQKIINVCLNDVTKNNSILILSYVMNNREFINLVTQYSPTQFKVDMQDSNSTELYKIQRAVAKSLRNIIPPSLVLSTILEYTQGDYLKLIQASLYSVCDKIDEPTITTGLLSLKKRAVSVRKHALHLTVRISNNSFVISELGDFIVNERNPSLRKFALRKCFKLFTSDPSDYLFEMVKTIAQKVDVEDYDALKILTSIDSIPVKFGVPYTLFIWPLLENFHDNEDLNKIKFLNLLPNSIIQALPSNFCLSVIKRFLFTSRNEKHPNIYEFTTQFIISSKENDELKRRIDFVLPILKSQLSDIFVMKNMLCEFLYTFCNPFLHELIPKIALVTFITQWKTYIKPEEAFHYYIYLELCLIANDYKNSSRTLVEIGKGLAEFCTKVTDTYGILTTPILCDILNSFVINFVPKNCDSRVDAVYDLINALISDSSTVNSIIGSSLLLNDKQLTVKDKHNKIVAVLMEHPDPVVRIHLHHRFHVHKYY